MRVSDVVVHGGGLVLRRIAKGVGIVIGALVVLVVVAVIASAAARGQARQLAAPTGPAAVGRIELSLTDGGRTDPFASDGRQREIPVWIWYPTATGNTGATAPYLPKTWADAANGIN